MLNVHFEGNRYWHVVNIFFQIPMVIIAVFTPTEIKSRQIEYGLLGKKKDMNKMRNMIF